MLLYLITQGCYSSTSVVALLSDELLAQRLAAHLEDGAVVPLTLDADANHLRIGCLPYEVWLDETGGVDLVRPHLPDVTGHEPGWCEYHVWATSEAEAVTKAQALQRLDTNKEP
jgi:hypothetical protein